MNAGRDRGVVGRGSGEVGWYFGGKERFGGDLVRGPVCVAIVNNPIRGSSNLRRSRKSDFVVVS